MLRKVLLLLLVTGFVGVAMPELKANPAAVQTAGASTITSCVEAAASGWHDPWKNMVCLFDAAAEWWRNGEDGSTWWSDRGGT